MEGHEHLALLSTVDTLHCSNQACSLGHEELLMVVRVVVGRQHHEDRASETVVDVIGHDSLKNSSLEDAIEASPVVNSSDQSGSGCCRR